MKSIRGNLNVLTKLSVLFFIIVLAASLMFFYLGFHIRTQTEDYRTGLSRINAAISALNAVNRDSQALAPAQIKELQGRMEAVNEFLDSTGFIEPNSAITKIPQRMKRGELNTQSAIDILGATARKLSSGYYQQRSRISVGTTAAMGVQILFLLFFIATLYLVRRFVRRFSATVNSGIDQLRNQFHSGDQAPDFGSIQWEEERAIKNAVEELSAEIAYNQELASFTSQGTLEDLLPKIFPLIRRHIPCTRIALAFIDSTDNVIAETAYSMYLPVLLETGFIEPIAETSLGAVRDQGEPRLIHDLAAHYEEEHSSKATELLLREGVRTSITVPLFLGSKCIGFFFISHNSPYSFSERHLRSAQQAANALKQTLYYHYLLQELLSQTSSAFVALTAKRDNETALHILRMSRFSQIIAKRLLDTERAPITPRFVREVQWFAQLHDIGKIGIPDDILLKPAALDEAEWAVMRSHVTIGEEIITNMDEKIRSSTGLSLLTTALDIISGHHEKYDGSGYPRGLSGNDIPLAGRIVALADVFDALISRRPYKTAFSIEKTLDIMRGNNGSHFDPHVFEAFEESLDQLLTVYEEYKEV